MSPFFKPLIYCFAALFLPFALKVSASEPPTVLASIKPLQLISQAITSGVSETDVLLSPGASPHSYSLRFSDRKKLDSADLVLWIGSDMEVFLSGLMEDRKPASVLTMIDVPGISQRPTEEVDQHDHGHEGDHEGHGHTHSHGSYDPHIWLNPDNALAMAKAITSKLVGMDTDVKNKAKYQANLAAFEQALKVSDERNKKLLAGLQEKPFFVFHDAFGHLEGYFGLNIAGTFTLSPEQQPGAKHLKQLRERLEAAGHTSIFREPQFEPKYISQLTEGLPVKIGVLDPLGSDITNTKDGYIQFMNALVDTLHDSLCEKSKPVHS
ncbi:zinc ABC transporter substrate-binding protein ZnuA [Candidatus Sororendozoicomonas aggregata]|uniref:zinc ABC transporter substrate-binding protein ZnuA n=1 Tax=Candidatus Sororendozoicomonas aggregata TaxID=3073239 RepID=UPI002ED239D1